MSQILRAEKLIQAGVAPSLTAAADPTVINLGDVIEGQTKSLNISVPVTEYQSATVVGPSHISVTKAGVLTINHSSFTTNYEAEVNFSVVFKNGLESTTVYYKYIYKAYAVDIVYLTPGTYSFIVPSSVTKVTWLAVGAGGSGGYTWANAGGGGGSLAWKNDMAVTPGETIVITVPGSPPVTTNGSHASIGNYFTVRGGQYSQNSLQTVKVSGSTNADGAGQGGHVSGQYGGGGGAGGYGSLPDGSDAIGGTSAYGQGGAGTGNGAAGSGGGYNSSTYSFGGGGGVGITGRGATGGGIPANNYGNLFFTYGYYGGRAGSNGEFGAGNNNGSEMIPGTYPELANRIRYHGCGGRFGGGGGGAGTSVGANAEFCRGAQGVVRLSVGATGVKWPNNGLPSSITKVI
jgi:hypothetical protein